ncbi:lipopolysaccharide biosynthesis protein [Salinarimonas ramus]|uniref:O-antigen/teichoic acid export membrane protein n=1 Tax=Salinarimonas ramus TaxID=690164 RepID=A0A917QER6_9HYPH|nr:oligosaccharide flippase family protein [Salinarimonas ramus]GGK47002.1 hypothetical protein GCM10011322_37580 [Salinarimonas ramus]
MNSHEKAVVAFAAMRAPLLLGRKAIEIASGIAVFVVLARVLDPAEFAAQALVLAIADAARVFGLPGLGNAQAQGIARGAGGGYRRAIAISAAGAILGAALLAAAAALLGDADRALVSTALMAIAAAFLPWAGLTFWRNAAVGLDRYDVLFVADASGAVVRAGAVVACALAFEEPFLPVVLATVIVPGACNVLGILWSLRAVPRTGLEEAGATRYGVEVSVYELPALLAQNLDRLLLYWFVSPEALAVYVVALRVPSLLQAAVGEAIASLDPLLARTRRFGRDLKRVSLAASVMLAGACAFTALVVVPWLLPVLAGERYMDAIPYAQIMTAGVAVGMLGRLQFRFVRAQLDAATFLHLVLARAGISIATMLALVASLGVLGAALAFVLRDLFASLATAAIVGARYGKASREPDNGGEGS